MFENIKIIENNDTVKQYYKLKKKYIKISEIKEELQRKFKNKKIMVSKNNIFRLNTDIKEEYKKYKQLISLKTKELNRIRQQNNLVPIFITLTNPSIYHPFVSIRNKKNLYKLNPNYTFNSLEIRVSESYKNINGIYRELYKNIKTEYKHIKFTKIIEPHKSLICHLHCLIYVKKENIENIKTKYQNILKKYNLKQCKFEILKKIKGCSYITKYILKTFNDKEMRMMDGWKKTHKIRMFTMSNLELNTNLFKKLYYNNKPLNEKIVEEIKSGVSIYNNLYEFYTLNTKIITERIDENGEFKIKINNRKIDNLFTVYTLKQKEEVIRNKKKYVFDKELETCDKNFIYEYNRITYKYTDYKNKFKNYLEEKFFYKLKKEYIDFGIEGVVYVIDRYKVFFDEIKIMTYKIKKLLIKNSKKEIIYDNEEYQLMDYTELQHKRSYEEMILNFEIQKKQKKKNKINQKYFNFINNCNENENNEKKENQNKLNKLLKNSISL